jgi:hypothetical protein
MDQSKKRYQNMLPLTDEEFAALKADIAERGVQVAVAKDDEGNILDGHHRVRAWEELRAEGHDPPRYRETEYTGLSEAEKRDVVWRLNMQRRHLNSAQKRDVIAAKLKDSPEWADNRIAKLLGVDHKTVGSVRAELERAEEIPCLDYRVGADDKRHTLAKPTDRYPEVARLAPSERRKAAKLLDAMSESDRAQARSAMLQDDPEVLSELTGRPPTAFPKTVVGVRREATVGERWHRSMSRLYGELSSINRYEDGFSAFIRKWSEEEKRHYLEELNRTKIILSSWMEILERDLDDE